MWRRSLVLLALCFSLSLSAQEWPSPSTDSPPAVSVPTSPTLSDIAARLSRLSTQLSNEASAQSIDLQELQNSLEESKNALNSSQQSLDKAARDLQALSRELWIWRGATVVASALAVLALVAR